jgi:hypothetical protein
MVTTLILIFFVTYGVSHITIKRFRIAGLIQSDIEGFILFTQSNTRGLLGYTLALQNFNARISAIALIYIVVSTLIFEPIQNLLLSKKLEQLPQETGDSPSKDGSPDLPSEPLPEAPGCFKSCLLNLHIFTLSNWLLRSNNNRGNFMMRNSYNNGGGGGQ